MRILIKKHLHKLYIQSKPSAKSVTGSQLLALISDEPDIVTSHIMRLPKDALFKLALDISLLRKTAPKDYEIIATFLTKKYPEWKKGEGKGFIALKLAVQITKPLKKSMFKQTTYMFEVCDTWQLAKLFRYPLFEKNNKLLQDYCMTVIEGKSYKYLNPRARFNVAALLYVVSPDDLFDRYITHAYSTINVEKLAKSDADPLRALYTIAENFASEKNSSKSSKKNTRKLRIALCVSGQLRGYEEAYKTWSSLGLDKHVVDVYVHTWKNIGRRFPDVDIVGAADRVFENKDFVEAYLREGRNKGLDNLQDQYPALFQKIQNDSQADKKHLQNVYGDDAKIIIEDEAKFPDFSNQDKMHYKIQKSFELVERSGKKYDLVIRIRPDKIFQPDGTNPDWQKILSDSKSEATIFTESPAGLRENITIGDQLAVGTPDLMRLYSYAWTSTRKTSRFSVPKNMTGHSTLAYTLLYNGIKNRICPGIRFGLPIDVDKFTDKDLRPIIKKDIATRKGAITKLDEKFKEILHIEL